MERKQQPWRGAEGVLFGAQPSVSRGGGRATPAWLPDPIRPRARPYPLRRRPVSSPWFPRGGSAPSGGVGRSQGCQYMSAGRGAPGAPRPPPVSSAGPEGGGLGSRPSCAVWRPARGRGGGGPGGRLSRASPPRPGRTAGSHYRPSPSPAPRGPGGLGGRGMGGYNQSQAGNSSRGARLGSWGQGGGPARSLAGRPRHPSFCEPAPRIMETGPPADPLAPLRIPASGGGRGESWAAPSGQRLGAPPVPPEWGPAPPPHSRWGASS